MYFHKSLKPCYNGSDSATHIQLKCFGIRYEYEKLFIDEVILTKISYLYDAKHHCFWILKELQVIEKNSKAVIKLKVCKLEKDSILWSLHNSQQYMVRVTSILKTTVLTYIFSERYGCLGTTSFFQRSKPETENNSTV